MRLLRRLESHDGAAILHHTSSGRGVLARFLLAATLATLTIDASVYQDAASGGLRIGTFRVIDALLFAAVVVVMFSGATSLQVPRWTRAAPTLILVAFLAATLIAQANFSGSSLIVDHTDVANQWRFPVALWVYLRVFQMARVGKSELLFMSRLFLIPSYAGLFWGRMNGTVGSDIALIAVLFSVLIIAFDSSKTLVTFCLLVLAPMALIFGDQRANAIAFPGVVLIAFWSRRSLPTGKTRTPVLVVLPILVSVTAILLIFPNPISAFAADFYRSSLVTIFSGTGNSQALQSRAYQYDQALTIVEQSWVSGNGLGATYVTYEYGGEGFVYSRIFHNIAVDLAVQFGIIIALAILAFLIAVFVDGIRRRKSHEILLVIGTFGLALIAKGMFESILDKPRTCLILSLLVSLCIVSGRQEDTSEETAAIASRGVTS